jgi:hypothetical protein
MQVKEGRIAMSVFAAQEKDGEVVRGIDREEEIGVECSSVVTCPGNYPGQVTAGVAMIATPRTIIFCPDYICRRP